MFSRKALYSLHAHGFTPDATRELPGTGKMLDDRGERHTFVCIANSVCTVYCNRQNAAQGEHGANLRRRRSNLEMADSQTLQVLFCGEVVHKVGQSRVQAERLKALEEKLANCEDALQKERNRTHRLEAQALYMQTAVSRYVPPKSFYHPSALASNSQQPAQ